MKQFSSLRLVLCSLLMSLSLGLSAQYSNIPCTGYNNDIIANDGSASSNDATSGMPQGVTYPTIWVDGNLPAGYGFIASDYKWWSGGPAATCGLVSGGNYPSGTTNGLIYTIQSTTADNSLSIASNTYSGSVIPTSGALVLVTPKSYTKLFVLYETVMNTAGPTITATITFTDASTQVITGNTVVNWFSAGISGYAGTMQRASNVAPGTPSTCQTTGPRLFEMPLTIDPSNYSKLVQSVTFEWSTATGAAQNTVCYFHGMALAGLAPCTSPPLAGTVTTTANNVCAGTTFTLSLSNGTAGTGQTYQWQSSPDGINWTTNPADTNSYLTTTQSGSTWYRSIVTCGGFSDTSAAFQEVSPALIAGGTFTINSAISTGGTNFQTFADAINYIKCGIAGPMVFNVAQGSGPYTEQVTIPAIFGTSATNTIIFKGNGETLKFASADGSNRHVLKLDGADFVTMDSFVIDATGGTYGWAIHMMNAADNDSIKNCTITGDMTATTTNFIGIIMNGSVTTPATAGNSASNTVIIGNTITGGNYGIYHYGSTSAPFTNNNKYINNTVNDMYAYGIYTYGSTNALISGNTIQKPTRTNSGATYGIYLSTYSKGSVVDKNRVWHMFDAFTSSTSALYAIYVSGDAVGDSLNLITNNLVSDINHNGSIYGVYNTGAASMKAYHNTISLDNAAATAGATYGFYQTGSDTGMAFINNLVTITRGGTGAKYGIYMSTSTTPLVSNYNDVYLNSTGTGTQAYGYNLSARTTLADWQTATGLDLNSMSTDPMYVSAGTDYTPTAASLDGKGTAVGVATDILGMPRNLQHPDMGAYEFGGAACVSPPTAGDATAPIDTVCGGASVILQLINNSVGAGQIYQWSSSSSATGPWTPLGGPSSGSDTTIIVTTSLWYRADVTCGAATAVSTPVYISVTQPLAGGTYTINSLVATGGTNFASFTDVANAVKCGITGPVVFNVVAGTGPYLEQFSLPALSGTSATNTVTFNGNGETIKFASADGSARYVVQLNGADYVTFKDFTIDATGGTYGFGIVLTNQANNDSIVNCTVMTDMTATSTNFAGIAITGSPTAADGAGNNASNTVVMNCTINGGYYGITNNGPTIAPFISNNQFIHNTINDFYSYGIYNYGSLNAVISQNTLQRPTRTNSGTVYAIYLNTYCTGALVEKNRVIHLFDAFTGSTSSAYCLYVTADATASTPNVVANNLVSDINHNGTIYGIYNTGGRYAKYYHNTISLDNTTATAGTTYGIYQSTIDTGIVYLNNIITITRGGSGTKYGFNKAAATTPPLVSDHNDIYVNSAGTGTQGVGYNGTVRTTLADWTLATALDSNSVSMDPLYSAPGTGDYHPTEATIDNLGTPVGILTDIENMSRSTTTPDMGAYEFGLAPVRLLDLSAMRSRNDALINWTTTGEINLSHFAVQRSKNGTGFEDAGTVAATGSFAGTKDYRFTDAGVMAKPVTLYYRLKMVNRDGTVQYSKTVVVRLTNSNETVTVYPNPVVKDLFVKVNLDKTQKVTTNLCDLSGRKLFSSTQTVTAGTAVLGIAGAEKLTRGMYILTVEIGGDKFNYKVVK